MVLDMSMFNLCMLRAAEILSVRNPVSFQGLMGPDPYQITI